MNGGNVVDIGVVVWLLIGTWQGARHGLTGELARLLAAGAAIFTAWHGCGWLGDKILAAGQMNEITAHGAAFILLLVAVYVLLRLIGLLLKEAITFAFKGRLEPIGGACLGLLTSALLITVLLVALGHWSNQQAQRWFAEDSLCGRLVHRQCAPLYERCVARYPALRIPAGAEPETEGESGEPPPPAPPAPGPEQPAAPAAPAAPPAW